MTEAEYAELRRRNPHLKERGEPAARRSGPPDRPDPAALARGDFDSDLEYLYYAKRVLPAVESGHIVKMSVHKSFVIAEGYTYAGRTEAERVYTPDFVLTWRDGSVEVVEVKHTQIKKRQRDYPLRRHLFMLQYVIPGGWRFFEYGERDI